MFASRGTARYGGLAPSAVRMRAGATLTESYTAGQRGSARSAAEPRDLRHERALARNAA
jgi:hypothetical protein